LVLPDIITWYDVLGLTAGASRDTIKYAYEERLRQLAPELFSGAPTSVLAAAGRAQETVETAWAVLGDTQRRQWYDAQMAQRRTPPRKRLTVPDVRGLFYQSCRAVVTTAGLRMTAVRLTTDPMPVEGLVIGQSLAPGSQARHQDTLTVQLWHPARSAG
jgi:DnaJ domain/PASTA domain